MELSRDTFCGLITTKTFSKGSPIGRDFVGFHCAVLQCCCIIYVRKTALSEKMVRVFVVDWRRLNRELLHEITDDGIGAPHQSRNKFFTFPCGPFVIQCGVKKFYSKLSRCYCVINRDPGVAM